MNVTLQRHCARYIYVVPEGLRELMSDISREVLRSQPQDIYTFIADYLDALLITRENARVSAKFVESLSDASETIMHLLRETGMTMEEASKSATVIQEAFKSWSERKGILKEEEDELVAKIIEDAGISQLQLQASAVVIQHAFRNFKIRQQKDQHLLSGIIDWRVAARSAIKLYRKSGVSAEEAKRAADLIKTAYKGYYTRRAVHMLNEQREEESESEEDSEKSSSDETEDRKSKGVRIDFTSVVPHVDFGDEELIAKQQELFSEVDGEQAREDMFQTIFTEQLEEEMDDEQFIGKIVSDAVDEAIIGQDLNKLQDDLNELSEDLGEVGTDQPKMEVSNGIQIHDTEIMEEESSQQPEMTEPDDHQE